MSEKVQSADRRSFIKASGVAGVVGLTGTAGCLGGESSDLTLILNPAEASVNVQVQYRPFVEYLESEAGVSIDIERTAGYTETIQALNNDQAELSGVSPGAVPATEPDIFDIIGMRIAFGAAQYFSTVHTTFDSPVEELGDIADLDDPEINFADPLSVSGTLVPLSMMVDAGIDVGTAPDGEPPAFTPNYSDHQTSREQMVEREGVVAAGTGAFQSAPWISQEQFEEASQEFVEISSEFEGAGENIGEEHGELQLLAVSSPLPRAPMVARANWDGDARPDIEDAMLNAPDEAFQHDNTEDVGDNEELWFTGVREADRSDFEAIQQVIDNLEIEFEDLI